MASRSFHDLLLRARDDLARTSQRGHALIVALIALHLAVIAPFADADRRQAALERERQRLEEIAPALDQLAGRLEKLAEPPVATMVPILGRLPEEIRGDLERLEATRWRLREVGDETQAEPVLAMRPPTPGTAPLPLGEEELRSLGQADNRYALLTVLEPILERTIVEPRFAEVQRRWQETVLPALANELDTVTGVLPRLRERFSEGNTEWVALERSLDDFRRSAESLRFEPPDRPYWWASPETAEVFELGIDATTAELLKRPLAFDRFATAAAEVRDRVASLRGLRQARAERAQGAEGELGRGLAALGIDLAGSVPFFPIALGLLVAVVLLRRGQRLRQLALATRFAVDHGAPDALRLWCLAEVAASGDSELSAGAAERRAQGRILGGLLLAWAWLALAGWQLHGPPAERSPEWLPTLLGAAAVLMAVVQRLLTAQGACQLLRTEGPGDDYYFHGPVDDAYETHGPAGPSEWAQPELASHDIAAPGSAVEPVMEPVMEPVVDEVMDRAEPLPPMSSAAVDGFDQTLSERTIAVADDGVVDPYPEGDETDHDFDSALGR